MSHMKVGLAASEQQNHIINLQLAPIVEELAWERWHNNFVHYWQERVI